MAEDKTVYKVIPCQEGVVCLDDYSDASIYVIQGKGEAIAIDTAMGEGNLPELIRDRVTKDPVELMITHGHGDHVMHAGEFPVFYMSPEDDFLLDECDIPLEKRIPLFDGDVIGVEGVQLHVILAAGHTPGSLIFVDTDRKAVFTGDAFGSGCGVWMQVPKALCMSDYRDSLQAVLEKLEALGADDSWKFYGGHIGQKKLSKLAPENELNLQLVKDMKTLAEKLLAGEITGTQSECMHFTDEAALYAAYGKAEMIYLQSGVH